MIFTIGFTLDSFGNLTNALEFPLPTKPHPILIQQAFFAGEQLLHQRLFLLLAIGQQLLGGGDSLIPSEKDLGNFSLLIMRWKWKLILFKISCSKTSLIDRRLCYWLNIVIILLCFCCIKKILTVNFCFGAKNIGCVDTRATNLVFEQTRFSNLTLTVNKVNQ